MNDYINYSIKYYRMYWVIVLNGLNLFGVFLQWPNIEHIVRDMDQLLISLAVLAGATYEYYVKRRTWTFQQNGNYIGEACEQLNKVFLSFLAFIVLFVIMGMKQEVFPLTEVLYGSCFMLCAPIVVWFTMRVKKQTGFYLFIAWIILDLSFALLKLDELMSLNLAIVFPVFIIMLIGAVYSYIQIMKELK